MKDVQNYKENFQFFFYEKFLILVLIYLFVFLEGEIFFLKLMYFMVNLFSF